MLGHAGFDFEPHGFAETALAQFGFDRAQQIVGFVFLKIEVGVARDAEAIRRVDLHAGKERVEIVRDDVFEHHEVLLALGRFDRHEPRQALRHFHAREMHARAFVRHLVHLDAEREREIGDVRKRMPLIDGERR